MDEPEQENNSQENDFSEIFSLFSDITNSSEDSKDTSLLNSLKPYLNEKRQKKIDQCEKIMMMINAFKLFNALNETEDNES
ncbi:MAG: hypothetical protein J6M02_05140 [Clostridia bacterium]|nr:hypothetical protein [Clostridia bacterium]